MDGPLGIRTRRVQAALLPGKLVREYWVHWMRLQSGLSSSHVVKLRGKGRCGHAWRIHLACGGGALLDTGRIDRIRSADLGRQRLVGSCATKVGDRRGFRRVVRVLSRVLHERAEHAERQRLEYRLPWCGHQLLGPPGRADSR